MTGSKAEVVRSPAGDEVLSAVEVRTSPLNDTNSASRTTSTLVVLLTSYVGYIAKEVLQAELCHADKA